ncbi:MAG: NlpC/P60 family protein [Planctomycetota bacterium]|jgi:NlpC/P60 family putative phage cell wall peptidase
MMHPWADEIIREARTYLGTPFRHQGRLRGVGVDCVGLVVGVGRALGILDHDNTAYPRQPDGETLLAELRAHMDEVTLADVGPGDVLVFWFLRRRRWPQHIGIATDTGIVHTHAHVGRVVEHGLDDAWRARLCHAFRFRGA